MSSVCRICLAGNTRQHFVIEKQLQSFYEKLTGLKFNSDEDRPRTICCFCYQRLLGCYTIAKMAVSSEKIFTQIDERGHEVTDEYINSEANKKHLSVTPVTIMNIEERASKAGSRVPIKEKPQPSIAIQKEASRDPDKLMKGDDCITSLLTSDEDDSQGNDVEVPFKMNVKQTKPDAPEPDSKVPFICNICNKIFYIKSKLISHINKHSQLTGRQYSSPKKHTETTKSSMIEDTIVNISQACRCKVCKKIFNRKANFVSHMRTHEPQKHPTLASPHERKCIEGNTSVMASQ